jgi:hypothetical protein
MGHALSKWLPPPLKVASGAPGSYINVRKKCSLLPLYCVCRMKMSQGGRLSKNKSLFLIFGCLLIAVFLSLYILKPKGN